MKSPRWRFHTSLPIRSNGPTVAVTCSRNGASSPRHGLRIALAHWHQPKSFRSDRGAPDLPVTKKFEALVAKLYQFQSVACDATYFIVAQSGSLMIIRVHRACSGGGEHHE